ncbi:TPA: hypothetical protein QDB06_000759 [Burkholderia vietnamiensis]|nr:hypothetical protein [Burkholderia vietnamiensis]
MKYSIELVLKKVKDAAQIMKETAAGFYDGNSSYYEGKIKLGDKVVADDLVIGDSEFEQESLAKIFRDRVGKYNFDSNKKETVDLYSEGAKVEIKNVTDEKFHTILRQFDFIKPRAPELAKPHVSDFSEDLRSHVKDMLQRVIKGTAPTVAKTTPEKAHQAPQKPFPEFVAPVAPIVVKEPAKTAPSFPNQWKESAPVEQKYTGPETKLVSTGEYGVGLVKTDYRISEKGIMEELSKKSNPATRDFFTEGFAYANDLAKRVDAHAAAKHKNADFNYLQSEDFKKAFNSDTKNIDTDKIFAGQNQTRFDRWQVQNHALKTMLQTQAQQLHDVQFDTPEKREQLLKEHKYQKQIFAYRAREMSVNKIIAEKDMSTLQGSKEEFLLNAKKELDIPKNRVLDAYKEMYLAENKTTISQGLGLNVQEVPMTDEDKKAFMDRKEEKRQEAIAPSDDTYEYGDKIKALLKRVAEKEKAIALAEKEVKAWKMDSIFTPEAMNHMFKNNLLWHDESKKNIDNIPKDGLRDFFNNTYSQETMNQFPGRTTGQQLELNAHYYGKGDALGDLRVEQIIDIAIRERTRCQAEELAKAAHDPALIELVSTKQMVEDMKFQMEKYKVENQNIIVQTGPHMGERFLDIPSTQEFIKQAEEKMHDVYVAWQEMKTGLSATPPTVEQVIKQNERKAKDMKVENKVEGPKFKDPMALRDSLQTTEPRQPKVESPKVQKETSISNMMQLRNKFNK